MNAFLWLMERKVRGRRLPAVVRMEGNLRTGTFAYLRVGEMIGCGVDSLPEGTMVDRLFRAGCVLKCPRMLIARIIQGKSRMKVITW